MSKATTFAREIEEFAGDEPIEAVAVSRYRREDYSHEGPEPYTDHTLGSGPSWRGRSRARCSTTCTTLVTVVKTGELYT
jgi:hypothetical protein